MVLGNDRIVVAIDGVDGAGKTTFADELATVIRALGQPVIQASIDGFHHPKDIRYLRGRNSPEGYFLDSYDYDMFRRDLLIPFRTGAHIVQTAGFNHRTNQKVSAVAKPYQRSILLVDGIFLHRNELIDCWDLSLFLDVPFVISYSRMAARDGSNVDPFAPENARYLEGQRMYLRQCNPRDRATILIDNADFKAPRILPQRLSAS
nr:uridine kinase [Phyllobacterium sp. KW56]